MLHPIDYIALNKVTSERQFQVAPKTAYINLNHIVKIEEEYYVYFNEEHYYHVVKLTDNTAYCITFKELDHLLNHLSKLHDPLVVINEI